MPTAMSALPTTVAPPVRRRWAVWILTVLAALGALVLLIWSGAVPDQRVALGWIWGSAALLFAVLSGMAYLLWSAPAGSRRGTGWLSALFIMAVALAARVIVLQAWVPSLSDDLFRYRHEGHLVLHGVEPYSYLPSETGVRLDPYTGQPIGTIDHQTDLLDRMCNNRELPGVYFPVSQWAFAAAAWFEERLISPKPYQPNTAAPILDDQAHDALWLKLAASPPMKPYRVLAVLTDLGVVALLLAILARLGRSLWWAALYAWHPLPLIEAAGNAHFEPLGVLFLLAGLYGVVRRRWAAAAALLALAFMVKPIAALAFPALLLGYWHTHGRPKWRTSWRPLLQITLVYALTVILALLPFAGGLHDLRISMRIVGQHFMFNGGIFELFRWLIFAGGTDLLRIPLHLLNILALGGTLWLAFKRGWSIPQTLGHCCVLYLLFSVMVYPWYALWGLALVPLAWNRAAWVLALTVLASYIVWWVYQTTGDWELSPWTVPLEWIPVAVLEGAQLWRDAKRESPSLEGI